MALLGNHHQRKTESDDVLDTILGSQGVAGTADTLLVLKKARGQADGELFITGRDVEEETERALRFKDGRWEDIGSAEQFRQTKERAEVIALLRARGPLSTNAVMDELDLNYPSAYRRLRRAAETGAVVRTDDERWAVQ